MPSRPRVRSRALAKRKPCRPARHKPPARKPPQPPAPQKKRQAPVERYTPALLANARHRWEETPEPTRSIAADLGIVPTSLNRLARDKGWVRRRPPPPRDLPPALRILEEARALDHSHLSPLAGRGRPAERSDDGRVRGSLSETGRGENPLHPHPLPASGERERAECGEMSALAPLTPSLSPPGRGSPPEQVEGERNTPPAPSQTPARPELSTTIDRLERAVLDELAVVEAMREHERALPQPPAKGSRTARTLATLTQTLQHLQRLRASERLAARPDHRTDHDDDMPADIDEFRRELARRIEAFVASRADDDDADRAGGAPVVDEVR